MQSAPSVTGWPSRAHADRRCRCWAPAGVGKTALLRRMHKRFPSSLFMECGGLPMDEVAPVGSSRNSSSTRWIPGARTPCSTPSIRRDAIILLANAQWYGPLFTSREPDRIAGPLATTFGVHSRESVRVIVEADSARHRVRVRRANEIILDEEPGTPPRVATADSYPELRALAASEIHDTP